MIQENIQYIEDRIAQSLERTGRTRESLTVVAVSKRQPLQRIREYCEVCQSNHHPIVLGENYIQEFSRKREALSQFAIMSHLLGPLQSNKVREAVRLFDVLESIHSEKILALVEKEAKRAAVTVPIFLQVNISYDVGKHGFLPEEINENYEVFKNTLKHANIIGLMAITKLYDERELVRKDFRALRELRDTLDSALALSMGMSADYEIAIEEGATHVRIGSALFGAREEAP